jgi:hypothetical protein
LRYRLIELARPRILGKNMPEQYDSKIKWEATTNVIVRMGKNGDVMTLIVRTPHGDDYVLDGERQVDGVYKGSCPSCNGKITAFWFLTGGECTGIWNEEGETWAFKFPVEIADAVTTGLLQ